MKPKENKRQAAIETQQLQEAQQAQKDQLKDIDSQGKEQAHKFGLKKQVELVRGDHNVIVLD